MKNSDHSVDYGYECAVCGQSIIGPDIDARHWMANGDDVHASCCTECVDGVDELKQHAVSAFIDAYKAVQAYIDAELGCHAAADELRERPDDRDAIREEALSWSRAEYHQAELESAIEALLAPLNAEQEVVSFTINTLFG
jgi:hypothetical protein